MYRLLGEMLLRGYAGPEVVPLPRARGGGGSYMLNLQNWIREEKFGEVAPPCSRGRRPLPLPGKGSV